MSGGGRLFFGDKCCVGCVVDPPRVGRLLHIVASREGREHFGTLTPAERDAGTLCWCLCVRGGEKKKDAVFLLCHIVITVIFNMKWLFVKENEGLVQTISWGLCRLCWCVRGGASAAKCEIYEISIWFFVVVVVVFTLTSMSACGCLNLLETVRARGVSTCLLLTCVSTGGHSCSDVTASLRPKLNVQSY